MIHEGAAMSPLIDPHRMAKCQICGGMVPAANLPEHLMADAKILRVIKSAHPEWDRREYECYLRAISSSDQPQDGVGPTQP